MSKSLDRLTDQLPKPPYSSPSQQVVYSNQKPAYYLNRQFKIVCSELSDRFTSNEYVQTVRNHKKVLRKKFVVENKSNEYLSVSYDNGEAKHWALTTERFK